LGLFPRESYVYIWPGSDSVLKSWPLQPKFVVTVNANQASIYTKSTNKRELHGKKRKKEEEEEEEEEEKLVVTCATYLANSIVFFCSISSI